MAANLELDWMPERAMHRDLRSALGCFATGVTVVTGLAAGGAPFGLTVNSFSSVSLDPPLVLWSLRTNSALAPQFVEGARFVVNVLGSAQQSIAQQFASACADRFAGVAWQRGHRGLPHLENAIAHFDCRLTAVHDAGDHHLLVARVEQFAARDGDPLLFVRGRYGALDSTHP